MKMTFLLESCTTAKAEAKIKELLFLHLILTQLLTQQNHDQLLYNRMLKKIESFNSNVITTSVYNHPNYHLVKKFLIEKILNLFKQIENTLAT